MLDYICFLFYFSFCCMFLVVNLTSLTQFSAHLDLIWHQQFGSVQAEVEIN